MAESAEKQLFLFFNSLRLCVSAVIFLGLERLRSLE
jgi:hypothetical protein